jgi:hypothetical protein
MKTLTGDGPAIRVLAEQKRDRVGTIRVEVGMLTNRGVVTRVTAGGVVFTQTEAGVRRTRDPQKLSVRLTEARKFGYPKAATSRRDKQVMIRRDGVYIAS